MRKKSIGENDPLWQTKKFNAIEKWPIGTQQAGQKVSLAAEFVLFRYKLPVCPNL